MEKKKIYFLAPKNKWGTYYYYIDISDYLIKYNSDEYNIVFCNSLLDYIKLHFVKSDIIFSIIPFFFKPLFTKKYIFNLHWNFKVERKNHSLGVKLLYLSELNLWFSDQIMLTSFYLADKLKFREKYNDKIIIVPNFVEKTRIKNQQLEMNNFNFMTITSFKFYDKWKWIVNLWNVIKIIAEKNLDKQINFTIIWNEENNIFHKIKYEFDKINFWENVSIIWKWWLSKNEIEKEFLIHNNFLYWSELDNYPGVILEAINYNLKVYVNNFESFKYFLDERIICENINEMIERYDEKIYANKTKIFSLDNIVKDNIISLIKNK